GSSINDDTACELCIYQPYCGLCPLMNYFETGNIRGRVKTTEKCKIMTSMFDHIFEIISNKEKGKMLFDWIK
ncbi:MAG: hypothetical protein V1944_02570, partial [Candidatus Aenigmatarchaeota archaeon]